MNSVRDIQNKVKSAFPQPLHTAVLGVPETISIVKDQIASFDSVVPRATGLSVTSFIASPSSQSVTVNGGGFQSGLTVTISVPSGGTSTLGGTQITSVTATSFGIAITVAEAGNYTLQVNNPNGQQSTTFGFDVKNVGPSITSVSTSPNPLVTGQQGTVTINGGNFNPSTVQVLFNGPGCAPCTVPNGVLTTKTTTQVVAPATLNTAGTYNVSVQNGAGTTASNSLPITLANLIPAISSTSPTNAVAGTFDLTINGSNFDSGAIDQVYWKATGAFVGNGTILSRFANQILVREFMTGATAGTYQVRVRNGNGQLSNAVDLTISAVSPAISSISPASPIASASNQTVTVFGSGFQSGLTVTAFFPNNSGSATLSGAQIQNVTPTSFQMIITLGSRGTWGIRVNNPDGKQSNLFQFTAQ